MPRSLPIMGPSLLPRSRGRRQAKLAGGVKYLDASTSLEAARPLHHPAAPVVPSLAARGRMTVIPLILPPPSAPHATPRSAGDAHASPQWRAHRRRRASRVGLGQQDADHHAHLRLVAVAGADDALLHQVGRVFGDRHAGPRRHHHGEPRAWPSFSVARASLLTKVASTAASSGRNSPSTRISPS